MNRRPPGGVPPLTAPTDSGLAIPSQGRFSWWENRSRVRGRSGVPHDNGAVKAPRIPLSIRGEDRDRGSSPTPCPGGWWGSPPHGRPRRKRPREPTPIELGAVLWVRTENRPRPDAIKEPASAGIFEGGDGISFMHIAEACFFARARHGRRRSCPGTRWAAHLAGTHPRIGSCRRPLRGVAHSRALGASRLHLV
jgi:hypothetical protein